MDEFKKFVLHCKGPRAAGERIGKSRQMVYLMLAGKRNITVDTAKHIEYVSMGRFKARRLLEL